MKNIPSLLAIAAATTLGACAMGGASNRASTAADDTAVVILPNVGAETAVQSGCWATFYDERNFNGSSLTLVGPVALQSLDKGSAQQLKRELKSVVTGPRATLVLYEKQLLSARSVGFQPNSREAGLVEKLGFGGRVESMSMTCS
jgi:hypothetical protein